MHFKFDFSAEWPLLPQCLALCLNIIIHSFISFPSFLCACPCCVFPLCSCSIDYNCPKCNKGGKCVNRIFIQRLPPILILHLNHFEYISVRKKQNYVDFPLRQLSLGEHALSSANLASCDPSAASNHHGTTNGGHYTSYCKPPQGDVWYQCDDKTITRLRTPVKTSTAYLLFYDSVHADI